MTQMLVPALWNKLFGPHHPDSVRPPETEEVPEVTITLPGSGDRILRGVLVQGNARHIPKDKDLWILVEAGGGFFPQPGPVKVAANGTWIANAYVGRPDQIGVEFGLIAVCS